jgi:3-oxoacyl-[acyl-carrier-protein] synthase-3
MSLKGVFITRTSSFLPNEPVSNDEMDKFLGIINDQSSKMRSSALRKNSIKSRYYALDEKGVKTHTNNSLTALGSKELLVKNPQEIKQIILMSCGTSSPDQMMPSHGVQTHIMLPDSSNCEVITPSANCCSGIYKGRWHAQSDYDDSTNILREISSLEKEAFIQLSKIKL